MPHDARSGPPNLQHTDLRSALEFAVRTAAAWQRVKPPLAVPAAIKSFAKQPRLAASSLGRIRRLVEGDDEFRARLAAAAVPELVDEVGLEWLQRTAGWEGRIAELLDRRAAELAERDAERRLAHEERRRLAAEEATIRVRAELVALAAGLAERDEELHASRQREATQASELAQRDQSIAELKQEARHARDRAEAARRAIERVESELNTATRRAEEAEAQRDGLLAARAELPPGPQGSTQIGRLRELADIARSLDDQLTAMVAAVPRRRHPVEVPREAAKVPRLAAEFLLKVSGIVVLVDGYNVAKLAWPDLPLEQQRHNTLDAVDGVARRFGTEIAIVFDGADVVGAHAGRRRLVRVTYSPTGVTADDVIGDEVAALDPGRPAAVVTNDREVRRNVIAAGANVIASDAFVAVALR